MVTGSGPQNRDEEVFEHPPFAVIADYLARNVKTQTERAALLRPSPDSTINYI